MKRSGGGAARRLMAAGCVVCGALAFWSGLLLLSHWDDLWSAGDFYQSGSAAYPAIRCRYCVQEAMELRMVQSWGVAEDYLQHTRLEKLEAGLAAEETNYRFLVRDEASGQVLWGNTDEAALDQTSARETVRFSVSWGEQLEAQDETVWNGTDRDYRVLRVCTPEGMVVIDPMAGQTNTGGADASGTEYAERPYNQYGYAYLPEEDLWQYDSGQDTRIHQADLVLESGVAVPLTVEDDFMEAMGDYQAFQIWLTPVTLLFLAAASMALFLLTRLCTRAGRRRGSGEIVLSWWDRFPYELCLSSGVLLFAVLLRAGDPIAYTINQSGFSLRVLVGLGLLSLVGGWAVLALLLTTAVRLKSHTLLRSTLCWQAGAWIIRQCRSLPSRWPMERRTVCLFLLYLLGTAITTPTIILIPVYQGFVLWRLCRWVHQWKSIRAATGAILGGTPEVQIDTTGMYHDLREHAEQLNDLGAAINNAVDERLKSERFRAELITNVSHDLKTPLTSIINYVDLLKKTDIQDPRALEYIGVLDRKSQRLKKLTEDLVEASKASTGTLPVNLERLDFAQLLTQAMGEYEEKFQLSGLTPILDPAEGDYSILADGRHLWRVIDNLLGNCCKYALPGTRVYLDLVRWDGRVTLTVKNISRNPLNIPAEQLMERFVRGEAARTTEGSGLGLSIARSLTELQGGMFRLAIDGDLFKAVVSMPAAPAAPPPPVPPSASPAREEADPAEELSF